MKRSRTAQFVARLSFLAAISTGVTLAFLFLSEEASARVGGGQSYGGGSGGGGVATAPLEPSSGSSSRYFVFSSISRLSIRRLAFHSTSSSPVEWFTIL